MLDYLVPSYQQPLFVGGIYGWRHIYSGLRVASDDPDACAHLFYYMSEPSIVGQEVNRAQRRAGRTHKRLLDAALSLFNERGIDACSVEMITEKADLGKGTFYRHFDDKYAIVHALLNQVLSQLLDRIAKKNMPSSWEAAAAHILDEHAAFFLDNPHYHGFILQTRIIGHLRDSLDQKNTPPTAVYLASLEKILKPLLPATVPPTQPRRLACALAGASMGFLAFMGAGIRREEMAAGLANLREAFLKGAGAWVSPPAGT